MTRRKVYDECAGGRIPSHLLLGRPRVLLPPDNPVSPFQQPRVVLPPLPAVIRVPLDLLADYRVVEGLEDADEVARLGEVRHGQQEGEGRPEVGEEEKGGEAGQTVLLEGAEGAGGDGEGEGEGGYESEGCREEPTELRGGRVGGEEEVGGQGGREEVADAAGAPAGELGQVDLRQ